MDWRIHGATIIFVGLLVTANYRYHLNNYLYAHSFPVQFAGWYFLLLASFLTPYLIIRIFQPYSFQWRPHFIGLVLLAPLVFAWKMTAQVHPFAGFAAARYWNQVMYFPVKVAGTCAGLFFLRRWAGEDAAVMGLRSPATGMRPYFVMLFLMVPLILLAAKQPDFRQVYPKFTHALAHSGSNSLLKTLVFELAYGSDFFTIELFFRGFGVVYLSRWAGRHAILPIAAFYCIIHFGKPLGECISSFFGGMLLGIVSYRTGSIWGGLAVHLGIAWLMEAAPLLY